MEISGNTPFPPATTQVNSSPQQSRETAELSSPPPDTSSTPAQAQAAQAPDPSSRIGGQVDTFV
ncbi:hypothetical protein OCL06_11825 [Alteromonas sp. ASW11-19]|uniref:Uncharacterized protein n=1 Tax=Alteromonas salexigens TaxID=2982530 RepID=A0ABT2VPN2_9ALTE|nr:hypothetical protein [Alteromonas salexigens]MCU7555277.1 hypothetical protein [Alteromonas salexigens]